MIICLLGTLYMCKNHSYVMSLTSYSWIWPMLHGLPTPELGEEINLLLNVFTNVLGT